VILRETGLAGVLEVVPERHADDRGHFARTYDATKLGPVVQMSTSYNARAGTLRGMHLQAEPHGEDKLVRCTRGAVFDVAVDLRPGSPTLHAWHGVELSADNGVALWIPRGLAHGFQTLTDDAEVLYAMSTPFVPGSAYGVRWDDPAFGIAWPDPPPGGRILNERDASYPDVSATT
jgi:dTDP-4-dehydrorhamnose 3,5-epimerase